VIIETMAFLSIEAPSGARLDLIGGRKCEQSKIEACKERFAAQLVIDGKVVGSIPLDNIPEKDRESFISMIKRLRYHAPSDAAE